MVRLAILGSRGIPARYGGFETFAQELSTRLVEAGIDVTVFCETPIDGSGPADFLGVSLEYVDAPRLGPLSTIIFDLRCLWRARRGFEVVYMLGYGASPFCAIPRASGTRIWINMDGIEWRRSKWSVLARWWLRMTESLATRTATRLIADAEGIRAHLADRYRRLPAVSVIPYGSRILSTPPDPGNLSRWGLESCEYYLVVCRLEPENHIREIIDGFVASNSTHPLVIVGDHTMTTDYVVKLLETSDARVRFIGTVFDIELLETLRWHCLAYFHGHSVGGTNPSLLEALGCGNRIAAHDNVFNREVAADCGDYFSDSREVRDIVNKFDTEPPTDAERMRRFDRIRDHYTWERIADSYLALLRDVSTTAKNVK